MPEEQIIINYAIIERTFDKAGDAKAQWLMIRAISEPAPPKAWRPQCYSGSRLCSPDEDYERSELCEKCPYRKME